MSKTWTGTRCTLLAYKQLGNILSRKPFEKSKKTEKFLMQMKKNRTAQFMIQRLGTSKVWTQRKFIPNEHLANFCTICPCKLFFWLPHLPEATKCPFVGTNFNETILPCLFQFGRPVLFLKIQKIIKMLKLGRSRPLKVYNRNHQKNPRNKKRTIKKSLQNIIKMKNS